MSDEKQTPKIGAGHAEAMFRQGLSELRGAMYMGSSVAQPAQYGLYGTKTPGEVADARETKERDGNEEPKSILEERLDDLEREPPSIEPEVPQQERE